MKKSLAGSTFIVVTEASSVLIPVRSTSIPVGAVGDDFVSSSSDIAGVEFTKREAAIEATKFAECCPKCCPDGIPVQKLVAKTAEMAYMGG